jgi:hypothetical protein
LKDAIDSVAVQFHSALAIVEGHDKGIEITSRIQDSNRESKPFQSDRDSSPSVINEFSVEAEKLERNNSSNEPQNQQLDIRSSFVFHESSFGIDEDRARKRSKIKQVINLIYLHILIFLIRCIFQYFQWMDKAMEREKFSVASKAIYENRANQKQNERIIKTLLARYRKYGLTPEDLKISPNNLDITPQSSMIFSVSDQNSSILMKQSNSFKSELKIDLSAENMKFPGSPENAQTKRKTYDAYSWRESATPVQKSKTNITTVIFTLLI